MFQAASALTYLEALQLLHGDVKMSNIMLVNQDREPLRIKLIDFGIAHDVADIQLGDIFQTLPYRSVLETHLNLKSVVVSAVKVLELGSSAH